MSLKGIIFDVDGTLAETEKEGHLPACNEAFEQCGFPIRWSWEEFQKLLAIPGNYLRIRHALQSVFPQWDTERLDEEARRVATVKRELYINKYVPRLSLRPGVARLIEQAVSRRMYLGIVSTSDEAQIWALLRARLPQWASFFCPVLGKESGMKGALDSPLYRRCLELFKLSPDEVLALEDSPQGLEAARNAGIRCAIVYNDYTFGSGFPGAVLVVGTLEPLTIDLLERLCFPEAALKHRD
ncbi:HAD hydrolase-like protein [Candidatus Methylacidithermus pantelleriae]|uniref:Phosphorylated carbohydrates phosphatase n=1 Tax=Candidatus Methylacidithermus pantelleriae TaxID=2744239 RepID=A0A8J2BHU4_9BACT|nr:HAD hydrolase-like protein [Candidatus Methylacidithermus pantelleriae]CAF0691390.1 Phosphorylated carbohydrates phosphatase [Candidatus Methylacidithermus pantelleriae]